MKKMGFALISIAIILNLLLASMGGLDDPSRLGMRRETPDEKEEFGESDIDFVSVPALKHRDMITYDSMIYAVWRGTNTSSGEWNELSILAEGTTTERISDPVEIKDSFFQIQQCVSKEMITVATATLLYENSSGGSISLTGKMDMHRKEHWDMATQKPIANTNHANMTIDGLGAIVGGTGNVGSMKFSGYVRSWLDLTREYVPSIEELVYSAGQSLILGMEGTILQPNELLEGWMVPYQWEARQGLDIYGHETLNINVSSTMFEIVPYYKDIWVSNDCPFPLMVKDYLNYTGEYEDYNYSEYIIVKNEKVISGRGEYKQGTVDVPWERTAASPVPPGHYLEKSPMAEFKPWYGEMMPIGGSNFDESSFDLSPEDAMEFGMANSQVLQDFVSNWSDSTIARGSYNATKDPLDLSGNAGTYYWNISIGHKPTEEEIAAVIEHANQTGEWYYPWRCAFTVKKVVPRPAVGNPNPSPVLTLDFERLYNRSYINNNKYNYPNAALTMTSAEKIMYQDPGVREYCFDSNGLKWNTPINDKYIRFGVSIGDEGWNQIQDLMTMITGISLPKYDFAWEYINGWIGQDGTEFVVNVDVVTGQLLGVMYVEGTDFMKFFQ
ncbi:MAG: hypothetical protein QCI38_00685 [Candidatus Thermoplasmatota archaeon]|nr:hypothetical protein [Candidatus Thermoplasmatota archaeon]